MYPRTLPNGVSIQDSIICRFLCLSQAGAVLAMLYSRRGDQEESQSLKDMKTCIHAVQKSQGLEKMESILLAKRSEKPNLRFTRE